ncbi:SseB family protein [Octadecabacter sp. R77987]|uniref:SseB family protein n=1 Tax=Octadecabacter sp. R77987 TaxID=3093874 RepID=UPI00366C0A86
MSENATQIDQAHAVMEQSDDANARLRFYERLADGELLILLEAEPVGDKIEPALFPVEDQTFVLVFDRAERLAEFVGKVAPYAAMSGRALAAMLAGQGIGMALNPDVAPSSILIPATAVDWLAQTLGNGPEQGEARFLEVRAPVGLPEDFITALDRKLASAAGLARSAYLVGATYEGGAKGHFLAFVDAIAPAQSALAQSVAEALTFSGIEAGALDVGFIDASDAMAARLAKVGLRFDLPAAKTPATPGANPGMDPSRPPKLK